MKNKLNKTPYNLIFLDMDGVINCSNFIKKWKQEHKDSPDYDRLTFNKLYCLQGIFLIVPELLARINYLLSLDPNTKVVWSSSWRLGLNESKTLIEGFYNSCGFYKGSFLSFTPYKYYGTRGHQIKKWLDDYGYLYKIKRIAIIDDDIDADLPKSENDDEISYPYQFFHINNEFGFTESNLKAVRKWLKI